MIASLVAAIVTPAGGWRCSGRNKDAENAPAAARRGRDDAAAGGNERAGPLTGPGSMCIGEDGLTSRRAR